MIRLEFTAFDLMDDAIRCSNNNVTVFDGESMTLLATLCGSSIHPPIDSTESSMIVRFISDGIVTETGFSVKYTTVWTTSYTGIVIIN